MNNQELFRSLLNGEEGTEIRKGLETSSASSIDAESRAKAWDATFANLDEVVEDRTYASVGAPGLSSNGLHGIEFFDATVAAIIKSYSGIFCIENNMTQPNASLPYFNSYGVKTGEVITPNLGVSQTLDESDGYISFDLTVLAADVANPVIADVAGTGALTLEEIPMVPGSLKITVSQADDASLYEVITDNGEGSMIAGPGVLSAANVSYQGTNIDNLGAGVAFSFTSPYAATLTGDVNVKVEYIQDSPKQLNEVIKGELEYYTAKTAPIIVPLRLAA